MLHWWKRLLGLVLLRALMQTFPLLVLFPSAHLSLFASFLTLISHLFFLSCRQATGWRTVRSSLLWMGPHSPQFHSFPPACLATHTLRTLWNFRSSMVERTEVLCLSFLSERLLRTIQSYLTRWKYVTFNLRLHFPFRRPAPLSTTRCSLLCPCGPHVPCSIPQLYG